MIFVSLERFVYRQYVINVASVRRHTNPISGSFTRR